MLATQATLKLPESRMLYLLCKKMTKTPAITITTTFKEKQNQALKIHRKSASTHNQNLPFKTTKISKFHKYMPIPSSKMSNKTLKIVFNSLNKNSL